MHSSPSRQTRFSLSLSFSFYRVIFLRPPRASTLTDLQQREKLLTVVFFAFTLISTIYFKIIKLQTTFFRRQVEREKNAIFISCSLLLRPCRTLITHSILVIATFLHYIKYISFVFVCTRIVFVRVFTRIAHCNEN